MTGVKFNEPGSLLLTGEERRRVLYEWNDARSGYLKGRCVHELFAEQAAETPGAVALIHGEERPLEVLPESLARTVLDDHRG